MEVPDPVPYLDPDLVPYQMYRSGTRRPKKYGTGSTTLRGFSSGDIFNIITNDGLKTWTTSYREPGMSKILAPECSGSSKYSDIKT